MTIKIITTSDTKEVSHGLLLIEFPDGDKGGLFLCSISRQNRPDNTEPQPGEDPFTFDWHITRVSKIDPSGAFWILKEVCESVLIQLSGSFELRIIDELFTNLYWRGPLSAPSN